MRNCSRRKRSTASSSSPKWRRKTRCEMSSTCSTSKRVSRRVTGDMLDRRIETLELQNSKQEKQLKIKEQQIEDARAQNHVLVGKIEGEYCRLKVDLEVKTRETERLILNNKALADVRRL